MVFSTCMFKFLEIAPEVHSMFSFFRVGVGAGERGSHYYDLALGKVKLHISLGFPFILYLAVKSWKICLIKVVSIYSEMVWYLFTVYWYHTTVFFFFFFCSFRLSFFSNRFGMHSS